MHMYTERGGEGERDRQTETSNENSISAIHSVHLAETITTRVGLKQQLLVGSVQCRLLVGWDCVDDATRMYHSIVSAVVMLRWYTNTLCLYPMR